DVSHKGLLVMVHALTSGDTQITVINFSDEAVSAVISSEALPVEASVTDMMTDEVVARVDQLKSFPLELSAYQGLALLVK
ncbi:MAG TPA: hypothetical protein VFK03_04460, partial [Candidatus Saccharimonadales bacterium]|nr:hypothetical protein [Candidatus Saccharimonadales bacterium]